MRYSLLIIVSALVFAGCISNTGQEGEISNVHEENTPGGSAGSEQAGADMKGTGKIDIVSFLGDEIIEIIKKSKTIHSYSVLPEGDTAKEFVIYGYPVKQKGPDLSESQIDLLRKVLLSEDTYDFERAKRAYLFPEFAFIFTDAPEELILLIDYSRKELLFVYRGKEYKEDFDSAYEDIHGITDALFPQGN